jgi:asparagine synthase (glutamine-hydrolysing)
MFALALHGQTDNLLLIARDRAVRLSPAAALRESILAHAEAGLTALALTLDTGTNNEDLARANRTARNYGVEHEVITVDHNRLSEHFDGYLRAMDQPGIDGFNTYLISEACRAHGHPVALSGLGGGEVIGGYRYYKLEPRLRQLLPLLAKLSAAFRERMVGPDARMLGTNEARLGELLKSTDLPGRHQAFRALFASDEVAQLTGSPLTRSSRWHTDSSLTARLQFAQLDTSTYLQPTLLRDADVYSMWHGVELWVPFVDTRVVQAVLAAERPPTKLEMAEEWGDAYLLDKATEAKPTFRLPWERWISSVSADSRELLSQPDPWCGLLNLDVARAMISASSMAGAEPLRPWSLLLLARWLDLRGEVRSHSVPAQTALTQTALTQTADTAR